MNDRPNRFDRQARFAPLGPAGQERIEQSAVLLVGCGALRGVLAQTMVRCGVGRLVLVDRDLVEVTNLARQVLFEEGDLGRPKADAARDALARIGGPTRVEAHVEHLAVRFIDPAQPKIPFKVKKGITPDTVAHGSVVQKLVVDRQWDLPPIEFPAPPDGA